MARTKTNKSQAIRNYLSRNPNAKPREVIAALAEDGIKVNAALVGNVKNRMGVSSRRGRRAGRGEAAPDFSVMTQISSIASQLGGLDKVRSVLDTLEQLQVRT